MNDHSEHHDDQTLKAMMLEIGTKARAASNAIATASNELKSSALRAAAAEIRHHKQQILESNRDDVSDAETRGTKGAFLDRLTLDDARLEAIAKAIEDVAALHDPVGRILAEWTQPNGLRFERVSTQIGRAHV